MNRPANDIKFCIQVYLFIIIPYTCAIHVSDISSV